jgi:hypothetical protein
MGSGEQTCPSPWGGAQCWTPDVPIATRLDPTGSTREVGWICALDPSHRWRTPIENRTRRLTGCGAMRGRAAVAHRAGPPDLARLRQSWGPFDLAPGASGGEVDDEDLVEASA